MSQASPNPKDLLNEGATRAKNMGFALVMIGFLLTKYFFQKILWVRLERVLAVVLVQSATVLGRVYVKVKPHLERFRVKALETRNQAVRVTLGVMIALLTPLESAVIRLTGVARVQSEKLAVQGTNTALAALLPALRAVGTAVRSGLNKPAFQKALGRLLELVAEAEKAK